MARHPPGPSRGKQFPPGKSAYHVSQSPKKKSKNQKKKKGTPRIQIPNVLRNKDERKEEEEGQNKNTVSEDEEGSNDSNSGEDSGNNDDRSSNDDSNSAENNTDDNEDDDDEEEEDDESSDEDDDDDDIDNATELDDVDSVQTYVRRNEKPSEDDDDSDFEDKFAQYNAIIEAKEVRVKKKAETPQTFIPQRVKDADPVAFQSYINYSLEEERNFHKYRKLKKTFESILDQTEREITFHPRIYNSQSTVNPRQPGRLYENMKDVIWKSFEDPVKYWDTKKSTADIPDEVLVSLNKYAKRFFEVYEEQKDDQLPCHRYVQEQLDKSLPRKKRFRKRKRKNKENKQHEATQENQGLDRERLTKIVSLMIHKNNSNLEQRQEDALKHNGLGYVKRDFPFIYSNNNSDTWFTCRATSTVLFSHPRFHLNSLPLEIRKEFKENIVNDDNFRDPFYQKCRNIEDSATRGMVRSWNLPEYKIKFPPRIPMENNKPANPPDATIQMQYINLVQKYVCGENTDNNTSSFLPHMFEYHVPYSQAQESDPLFHYGRDTIYLDNTSFHRILSDEQCIAWDEVDFFSQVSSSNMPNYNNIVYQFPLCKELFGVLKTWGKTTPSGSSRPILINHFWKHSHYRSWELHNERSFPKYGYLNEETILKNFEPSQNLPPFNPEELDLSYYDQLGYKPVDEDGDGNCAFYGTFLAMVNSGRWTQGQISDRVLVKTLQGYSRKNKVVDARKKLYNFIKRRKTNEWFDHPNFLFLFENSMEAQYDFNLNSIYSEEPNYLDRETMKNQDFHPMSWFYCCFHAWKERIRVVLFTHYTRPGGENKEPLFSTEVFDYRDNQVNVEHYIKYGEEIYRIPDEEFDCRDTIEILNVNYREDGTDLGHFLFMKRVSDPTKDKNHTNNDEGKWDRCISNSNVLSIPIPVGNDGDIVSIYVCNYRSARLTVDKTFDGEEVRPFIVVNCDSEWLDENDNNNIRAKIYFVLLMLSMMTSYKEKIGAEDNFTPSTAPPQSNIVVEAYKKARTFANNADRDPWKLDMHFMNNTRVPKPAVQTYWNFHALINMCAATLLYSDGSESPNASVNTLSLDEVYNKTIGKVWMFKDDDNNVDNIKTNLYKALRRGLSMSLYYIRSLNVLSYGEMTDAEKEERSVKNIPGNLITVDPTHHKEFTTFLPDRNRNYLLFPPTNPQGQSENEEQKETGNNESEFDNDSFEDKLINPELPLKRRWNPQRMDDELRDSEPDNKRIRQQAGSIIDEIAPKVTKKVYDVKRIKKIATIFATTTDRKEKLRDLVDGAVHSYFSSPYENYKGFVSQLAHHYHNFTHDLAEERTLLMSKKLPKEVKDHIDYLDGESISIDARADYSIHEKGGAVMQLGELMIAHSIRVDEYNMLKTELHNRRLYHQQGPTQEEQDKLHDLKNSVSRLKSNMMDKLDLLFPNTARYGFNYSARAQEISKLRYNCNTKTFYGMAGEAEEKLPNEWVYENFNHIFVEAVIYISKDGYAAGRKRIWVPIPAGDSRWEDGADRTITEIELLTGVTFIRSLKIMHRQGRERHCVACSFASALSMIGMNEVAEYVLEKKEDLCNKSGYEQVNDLNQYAKDKIPEENIRELVLYTRPKTVKKYHPKSFLDKNCMWFVIPMSGDGGTNHAFVIMNLDCSFWTGKIVVDANDPHPLFYSKRSLNFCCGLPAGYKSLRFILKIAFKNITK